jgi:N6-L-threonylcarbamoyladenine synthase
MLILGIESSCDETASALVRDGEVIVSEELATQTGVHSKFGGVVPELACRGHVEVIDQLVEQTFANAGVSPVDVDAVAVTAGPGLAGALLVGVAFAKGFAYALDRPLIGINHLEGHIVAPLLSGQSIHYPAVALIVSGGHTHLYVVEAFGHYRLVGRTIDDAAGEAFDKAAYCLGLGFPGGPAIDRLAGTGDPTRFRFPRALTGRGGAAPSLEHRFDVSFSGLKTAFVQTLRRVGPGDAMYPDLAAGFQAAVVDVLVEKTIAAARSVGVTDIIIGGGVAANSGLRAAMAAQASAHGFRLVMPTPRHCTDNAAMIAAAAFHRAPFDQAGNWGLNADPSLLL